jgi:hypothetical protein
MSAEVTAAMISGLFSVLTLGITFWVRRGWDIRFEGLRAAIANDKELTQYLELYFVKLDEAVSAYGGLCKERNLSLDTKAFIAVYSAASDKWSQFKTYSAKKETLSLSTVFVETLSSLKETIERLTIELSMDSATRLKRRKGYEELADFAKQKRNELVGICRSKRAAA